MIMHILNTDIIEVVLMSVDCYIEIKRINQNANQDLQIPFTTTAHGGDGYYALGVDTTGATLTYNPNSATLKPTKPNNPNQQSNRNHPNQQSHQSNQTIIKIQKLH
jgi:hypothetical protein